MEIPERDSFTLEQMGRKQKAIKAMPQNKAKRGIFATTFRWLLITILITGFLSVCAACAGGFLVYLHITKTLPQINGLRDYRPSTVSSVFSDDGTKIGEFYKERRIVVPLSDMPENLKNAFVAAEDSRFREHVGVDPVGIFRAFIKNLKAGAIVQGGSTITQQVTKSFLLTPERTYERKIREAILAYRIEKNFSKDEILYLYLNQIYLGHGAYGVEAAAENYFGKHVKELNLAECSMLAGLPQAPSRYSPFRYPDRATQRQQYVLTRMHEEGYITAEDVKNAMNTALDIHPRKNWFIDSVPCYTEHVRRYVVEKYGEDALYHQGLKIHTAVNVPLQKIARKAVVTGLYDLDRRQGYRGPIKNLVSTDSKTAMEEYIKDSSKSLNGKELQKDTVYKAVVVEVNDKKKITQAVVGEYTGTIDIKDISWARKPNPEVGPGIVKIKKPSQVFKVGDVILVKAVKKYEEPENSNDIDANSNKDAKKSTINKEEEKSKTKEKIKQPPAKWIFSLEQEPAAEAALLSIEAETGLVKAMIGGRNYLNSQFNRAIQSSRQPGSAFKPIIYAAALDRGYTAASVIIDSPIVFDDSSDKLWKPHNYSERFYGPTLFRHALVKSRNVVTVKIVQDIGMDYVIQYARKLGITSPIGRNLAMSLGSAGLSLLELVNAYSVFANLGYFVEPVFITRIEDREGSTLEQADLNRRQVIEESTAYIMTNILESVITSGTGWRVKALERPAAGKTGTTNNLHDALFIGFTPEYITGVWVGFDLEKSLGKGETGSRSASPIWLDYMQGALDGKPVKTFTVPEGVVFAKVDAKTGLLPSSASEEIIYECFKEGTVPNQTTPSENDLTRPDDLFKSDI
ncbi:MrcA [Desulfamplus magnetovallimortis]|uniref:Penicillin-binding protein 1A n=1 Tax=Desulfamplus magnetovallimortis TaxID=1246637 RepID=A0A1W1H9D8_9BACT|nr:PBP1A family penicillin-binding protein [Desulfamplus magnetovallimortis]SLM29081.1 MrcA [Desulfamplus magnetovallimortis]